MLSAIISYLNGLLADTGYFSEVKGLSVLIKREGKTFPAYYCNGEYEPATNFDTEIGLCYWRFRSEPTDTTVEAPYQVNKILRRTYPLRLICAVMRDQLGNNDNAYAEDSLSLAIEKVIKDREREVRSEARALAAQILWRGVITSAETMKNTELLEIEASIQARMLFMGIDVDIVVDYQGTCINDFCGVDTPTNLTAVSGTGTIELSWVDNSDNETDFRIYRSTSPTGTFTLIATKSAGVTTHSDTTVSPWQFYFYKVAAFNADAQSAYSNVAWSMTGHGTLRWDSATGASTFSLPSLGETLGINLLDAAGGYLDVTITSAAHVPATDSFDIVVANQVFRDEDDAGIALSTEFNNQIIVSVYNSDGTTRLVNAITGLFYSAGHLRVWVGDNPAPHRPPVQLFGSSLYTGDLDYLWGQGRFQPLIPPGRTKVKKLEDFLTFHSDNPRPDGSFSRFQTGTVVLNSVSYPYTIDWLQELFCIAPSSSGIAGPQTNQAMHLAAIAIHPMLRLPRFEELYPLIYYPPTGNARIYTSTSSNQIRTINIIKGTIKGITLIREQRTSADNLSTWDSVSNFGSPMLVCYLEEMPGLSGVTYP